MGLCYLACVAVGALFRFLLFGCAGLLLSLPLSARAELVRLPIVVHMAQENGGDVAPSSFVRQQLERANAVFAPYGLAFDVASGSEREFTYSGTASRMESRADRDALSAHVSRGAIHCFVVASLRDVDEPERMRRGVHWHVSRESARPYAHYIILSAISEPFVLSHELGHYLGNPTHSKTPGNLMSYERTEALPFLDAAQQGRLRRAVRAYLRRGELRQSPKSAAP